MTCCGPPPRSRVATPPAALVGKLCSSKRQQNTLTTAIKEYGALRRTVHAARYLANAIYRRRVAEIVGLLKVPRETIYRCFVLHR
jgi:TnpA family transposase